MTIQWSTDNRRRRRSSDYNNRSTSDSTGFTTISSTSGKYGSDKNRGNSTNGLRRKSWLNGKLFISDNNLLISLKSVISGTIVDFFQPNRWSEVHSNGRRWDTTHAFRFRWVHWSVFSGQRSPIQWSDIWWPSSQVRHSIFPYLFQTTTNGLICGQNKPFKQLYSQTSGKEFRSGTKRDRRSDETRPRSAVSHICGHRTGIFDEIR